MFDLPLALTLTFQAFSLKRGSLRFPTGRRLFNVFVGLPLFFALIVINRFFMLLDHIFFPGFGKMNISNPVFITGVPRSATTYLYKLLAQDEHNFTCFRLWEILFAPSIIQKHIFSGIRTFDLLMGGPLYRVCHFFERMLLSRISQLHEMSLLNPEEDELLLTHAFSSVYLVYFFPDLAVLDSYLFFDEEISDRKRKKIMCFYKACVQRHIYYYDRNEEKCFLSKNPGFISKTTSVAQTFGSARLIYMLRSPYKTIPSTISLNRNIYSVFSGEIEVNPLALKTNETIIRWYKMAERSITDHWQGTSITVPFKKITGNPFQTVSNIYTFLKRSPGLRMNQLLQIEQESSTEYATTHVYTSGDGTDLITQELDFILHGPFCDDI